MGCSQKIRYLMFFSLWSVAILRTTDGTAITWYEPPPMTEITNNSFFHAANRSLTEGSANVPLSWNFSLSAGSNVITVTLSFKGATVVTMLPAVPNPTVEDPFNGRFGVSWNPSTKATLIINNVNTVDNGEFTCEVFTLAGSKTTLWTSKVQVTVFVPPRITDNSGNLTVTEGQDVTLECQATGNPTPERTWTRLSNNSVFNGTLPNIRRQDTGGYRCTANNSVGSPATKDIFITVQYPPSTNISGNITVNDTDTVTLNCGEDGVPDPNIAWRRLSDNSSVPVTFNISGKQDEGYYRCTADNGIGNPATGDIFIAVEHYRPRNTSLEANLNDSTVVRNTNFNLTCRADANPPAKYELRREQNSLIRTTIGQDSFTNTTSVNERIKQVTYSCTPFNDYGVGPTETINVTVHYNPANVTLLANTTENKGCSDSLWVNFTCVASEKGNPAVGSYQLYRNEKLISASHSGTWNEEITEKGKHDYSCLAIHRVKNMPSSNNVTVTFNVLSKISDYPTNGIVSVHEGGDVSLHCNVSGFPKPTITWSKDGEPIDEPVQDSHWLNFIDIKRDEAGNYRCHANNTCGERDSSLKRIDVQYKPENVTLKVNISSNKVCADAVVRFACTAKAANPVPGNYTLYENSHSVVQDMQSPGVWIRRLNTVGEVTYRCEARNSIGNDSSSNTTFTVEVPVNITVDPVHGSETLVEGGDLYLYCSARGFPGVTVSWLKVGGNAPDVRDSWLNFTRITRDEAGDYFCHGNNTCGRRSSSERSIDVQYKPENVSLNVNIIVSNYQECADVVVNFTCTAEAANPQPHTYTLFENGSPVVQNMSPGGIRRLNTTGEVTYRCEARNSIGNDSSSNTTFTVGAPAVTIENDTIVVKEGSNVTLFCKFSGFPSPSVSWVNNKSELMKDGDIWRIPNIRRNYTGEYNCLTSNACGNDSKRAVIDVQYRPLATRSGQNITVSLGRSASFDCPVDGNPEPNITWYKGSTAGETLPSLGKALNFTRTQLDHTGCYTCSASNILGTDTITNCLEVVSPRIDLDVIYYVPRGGNASLYCQVEDHPLATITWTQCGSSNIKCGGSFLNISEVQLLRAIYTCKASSDLVDSSFNTTLVIGGEYINLTLTIRDVECTEENGQVKYDPSVLEALKDKVHEIFADYNYSGIVEVNVRCGSLHVDLVLKFNNPVAEDWVISTFQGAVKNGKLGKLSVNASSIVGIAPVIKSTVTPPITKATPKSEGADGPPWAIIGGVVGAVVVLVIVIAVLTWCVHKKRKCRKDTKIGHSESEAQVLQEGAVDDNAYSQVNHGYARSGPPSANEVDRAARQEAAAAVPTYAVVDKSKKKKKQQEEKPPEYAIVDKSKKKKKKDEKEDYTYAEVDMSKKSSKKQQPKNTDGLVYADLGDFQRPQMPPVSTSPAALPPVKRPPSYEGTQYADITEFMKGDATLPKKRNSQGMEMQPQASAPANVNSQGNEVKPQGANKDESGVPPKESKL